jgi:RNA polymerase-interacting CarD/CdnL/TRCF family regulator
MIDEECIRKLAMSGKKSRSAKLYRDLYRVSQKEARDAIERLMMTYPGIRPLLVWVGTALRYA